MTVAEMDRSWAGLPAAQQPEWPDRERLHAVKTRLEGYHPLVSAREKNALLYDLGRVCRGKAFLLQGGDCAEDFGASEEAVRAKLRLMLMMNLIIMFGGGQPVVRVGRIGGQYAKPRSKKTEVRNGVELPSFRGMNINGPDFTLEDRTPNPERMERAYHDAVATLNLIRMAMADGFASLTEAHEWIAEFVRGSKAGERYKQLVKDMFRALKFMAACGSDPGEPILHFARFWVSHELLLLDNEEPFRRVDPDTGRAYDLSAHFLWIGDRTRQPDGAHVAFAAQTDGPIGLKVGPSMTPSELVDLCRILNPANIEGRLTLITRFGADKIRQHLPELIRAVHAAGCQVIWQCDPMHGNGEEHDGTKTRHFDQITREVEWFFEVCRREGAWPGGVHLENTADNVTECLGGGNPVLTHHLRDRYETLCDPRLNAAQSLELAFLVARLLQEAA